jgi:hypothetical protein
MEAAALVEMSVGLGYVKCDRTASMNSIGAKRRVIVPDTEAHGRP